MFKTYYGLTIDPFTKETETKHFYKSKEFKEALNRLEFLKSTKGIGLITGQPGAGKTSLLRYFESTLNSNLYKCVYIPLSTLTVMDFYKALCDGLGVNPGFKKVIMFKQIQEAIHNLSYNKNITPVIILDEAQYLKNAILDDLRIILNFNMDSKDYAILLLVGQMTFINQLQRQNHDALRQRIVVNYYLNGLTKEETKEYITSRLALAGCHEPIFTDDALELLFSCTNGLLRPLNSIARLSLIQGAAKQTRSIDSDIIFNAQKEVNLTI